MDELPRHRALMSALDLASAPRLARRARRQPLPEGVLEVIRIAAGCEETLRAAADYSGRDPAFIKAAAQFYVHQILLFSAADKHRVLGVRAGAGRDEIRLHMRWLMTWLHPDRGGAGWQAAFAARVLEAWRDVGRPAAAAPTDAASTARPGSPPREGSASARRRLTTQPHAIRRRLWRRLPSNLPLPLLLLLFASLLAVFIVLSAGDGAGGEAGTAAARSLRVTSPPRDDGAARGPSSDQRNFGRSP